MAPRHPDVLLGAVATVEDDHLQDLPVRVDHDHGGQGTYLREPRGSGASRRSRSSSRAGPVASARAASTRAEVSIREAREANQEGG